MTDQPITPPPELLKQWEDDWFDGRQNVDVLLLEAFQAGADQELEACREWLHQSQNPRWAEALRAARRPKPPSLKEQALEMLENAWEGGHINNNAAQTIRRALEALPND
jgi:hypothetical protein